MARKDIALTSEQIFGTENVILTAQTEQNAYVNGERTEKISGVKISVVSPMRNFQTFNVKIENGKLLEVSEDEIDEACASMKPIWVRFKEFKAKPYASSNIKGIAYSCSASDVEIVDMDEVDFS